MNGAHIETLTKEVDYTYYMTLGFSISVLTAVLYFCGFMSFFIFNVYILIL
jgi:hypothetical protein